jgi:hypothetical protein
MDTKKALFDLHAVFQTIVRAGKEDVPAGQTEFYIYRTNEQFRALPVGKMWPGGFVAPYRAAIFEIWRWAAKDELKPVQLWFAEVPDIEQADLRIG